MKDLYICWLLLLWDYFLWCYLRLIILYLWVYWLLLCLYWSDVICDITINWKIEFRNWTNCILNLFQRRLRIKKNAGPFSSIFFSPLISHLSHEEKLIWTVGIIIINLKLILSWNANYKPKEKYFSKIILNHWV